MFGGICIFILTLVMFVFIVSHVGVISFGGPVGLIMEYAMILFFCFLVSSYVVGFIAS